MTWSPPLITTGTERRLLEGMLERNRAELIGTIRGLSESQARRRLVPSATTPIGLVKHAAVAQRIWFQRIVAGIPAGECDGPTVSGDPSFVVADDETVADVIAEFERTSARAREIAADVDLDDTRIHPRLGEVSLRFIYVFLIEELARHAGHGDILREQLDSPESAAG
ncbi:DinB family protein [Nocardia veterana]|uniref:DinB family protein n=1 Tax=Nocardia veterana TaxID=132249 RepID=A0A7X6LZM1_9NOCA|nr:DinB family protein [Nocardia veterana]NKY87044.1 DinB family protein [Nocardia veterana]